MQTNTVSAFALLTNKCMHVSEGVSCTLHGSEIYPTNLYDYLFVYGISTNYSIGKKKKKKKAYEPCQQGAMAFPLQPNDTHNCEMTYDSKAVIKRKPFPIEEYWHEAHSARKFIGWRWGMGKGNEQGVLEADLINVVDRKGECVQHSSRA